MPTGSGAGLGPFMGRVEADEAAVEGREEDDGAMRLVGERGRAEPGLAVEIERSGSKAEKPNSGERQAKQIGGETLTCGSVNVCLFDGLC